MRALFLALATLTVGCAPATILSAKTIKDEPKRVYPQLAAALKAHYQCSDETDENAFTAMCKSARGGISVEIKRKPARPVLSLHFWVGHEQCGTQELAVRMENFVLEDAAGGTRAYCAENHMFLAFESFLPARGIEPAELASFVVSWEKNASAAAARLGLFIGAEGKKS